MEMELKLKSPVPMLAKLCPNETIHIWKSEHGLRIDWSISKIKGTKLFRAPMSLILHIKNNTVAGVHLLNRRAKIMEEVYPQASVTLQHDLIDRYLMSGTRRDNVPLSDIEWSHQLATNFLGKKKTVRKSKFKVDTYEVSGMSWIQQQRIPCVQRHYEECTASTCGPRHGDQDDDACGERSDVTRDQVMSLEALQFISESEIYVNDHEWQTDGQAMHLPVDDELLRAERMIVNGVKEDGSELKDEDVGFIERILEQQLSLKEDAPGTAEVATPSDGNEDEGHSRQGSGLMSLVSKRAVKSIWPGAEVDDGHHHVMSFPEHKVTDEVLQEYFDRTSSAIMTIGRPCRYHDVHLETDRKLLVHVTKDIPLKLTHLIPLLNWLTQHIIEPGQIQSFLDTHQLADGFPIRFGKL